MTLAYLSVCSGIEAASVAWHTLGWRPVAFSEIEPFACAMLAARFPLVPNLGDMERYREWPIEPGAIDVLVGGTPCQSFSVAGLRKGLDDPRGNLALVYLGLVDRFRPRWIVWENVPGVLSADGGRAFGAFFGGLAQLGYGFAYRVLDAQYTRVDSHPRALPQRRRRVFVVGCARGDWRRAASVLLEPDGVRGDPPTRRTSREGTPRGPAAGARDGGVGDVSPTVARALTTSCSRLETLIPLDTTQITSPANRSQPQPGGPAGDEVQNLVPTVSSTLGRRGTRSHTELDGHGAHVVEPLRFDTTQITSATLELSPTFTLEVRNRESGRALEYRTDGTANALRTPNGGRDGMGIGAVTTPSSTAPTMVVRRLTPRECERLQGFPDDWTAITYRGKPAADGPRYKALGNSMAVNVMRWIGLRIAAVEGRSA